MASKSLDWFKSDYDEPLKAERHIIKTPIEKNEYTSFLGEPTSIMTQQDLARMKNINEEDIVMLKPLPHAFTLGTPKPCELSTPNGLTIKQFMSELKAGQLQDVYYEMFGCRWTSWYDDDEEEEL